MKYYPAVIPFDILGMLPIGKPDSCLVWYVANADGDLRPCVRWIYVDSGKSRVEYFDIENGKIIPGMY